MKSLRIRMFIFIAGLIVLFGSALMILNWGFLRVYFFDTGKKQLRDAAAQIAEALPEKMSYNTTAFKGIEQKNDVEIIIYTNDGAAVYATQLRDFDPETQRPDWLIYRFDDISKVDIISQTEESETSRFEIQRAPGSTSQFLAYRTKLTDDYWAVIRMSADMLRNSASVANSFMGITVAVMLLVALVFSAIIAEHLSKPIREMNTTTLAMSRFDFSHKVNVVGSDEIAQLGNSINTLSDNTSALLSELSEKNARLEKEVERERALEKMRKEFISNVSHELKTPIAIIQGYAEGLQLVAGNPERRKMYCEIIENESYKMDRLVKELLELSRLESGQYPMQEDAFNLTDLLIETVGRIASITDDVKVTSDFDDDVRPAYADEMRMGEVLSNYLNHAIAHCKGEMRVSVTVKDTETGYRVSVFNTGDPIPDDILENIWQSFYRADKSRSRENGNAGLGLSIVRSIMEQHKQQYGVENVEGGVKFWFDVKRYEDEEPVS